MVWEDGTSRIKMRKARWVSQTVKHMEVALRLV
jgi:hypothetical protein